MKRSTLFLLSLAGLAAWTGLIVGIMSGCGHAPDALAPAEVLAAPPAGDTAPAWCTEIETPTTMPASLLIGVEACRNNPGAEVTFGGTLALEPLRLRWILRNQRRPGAPHEVVEAVDVTVAPATFTITLPKQPVLGGTTGNPWISVQRIDGAGNPIGDEILVGRCRDLCQ